MKDFTLVANKGLFLLFSFSIVGIFVVMFFQVAKTIGKSGVVVILVMISCALPFYVLFKLPDEKVSGPGKGYIKK